MSDQIQMDPLEELMQPEVRELDLGGYDVSKKGVTLKVHVNAPGVLAEYWGRGQTLNQKTGPDGKVVEVETRIDPSPVGEERERRCKVVAVLYGRPIEQIRRADDTLLLWLYNEGYRLYNEFHAELEKNSTSASANTSEA